MYDSNFVLYFVMIRLLSAKIKCTFLQIHSPSYKKFKNNDIQNFIVLDSENSIKCIDFTSVFLIFFYVCIQISNRMSKVGTFWYKSL